MRRSGVRFISPAPNKKPLIRKSQGLSPLEMLFKHITQKRLLNFGKLVLEYDICW
jgi:hypothetical protein